MPESTRHPWVEQPGWGPAERLLQDLRGAFRMMRRNLTVSAGAAGTLALAIGREGGRRRPDDDIADRLDRRRSSRRVRR